MAQENTFNLWDKFERSHKLAFVESGLPVTAGQRKKVIVVGAGMAGLTAAYELKRAGHFVTLLEAQHRTGGRIWTLREPFSPGLYAEAGAMRLPRSHELTRAYIRKAGLDGKLAEFSMACENAFYYFNNRRLRIREYRATPERLGFDTPLHGESAGRLYRQTQQSSPIAAALSSASSEIASGRHIAALAPTLSHRRGTVAGRHAGRQSGVLQC